MGVLPGHFGELIEDNPDFCKLLRAEGLCSSNIPERGPGLVLFEA
jgi:hypothetical protein